MRRILGILLASLLPLVACGDDPVKPGDLKVFWSHGPTATCESRHVVNLEARAYLRGNLEGTASGPCPAADRNGSLDITDLEPGNYVVEVEAFDAAGKGLYLGRAERQRVREGQESDSDIITLVQKPVMLNVTWRTPTGMCAGSPVRRVQVQYIPSASTTAVVTHDETVACNHEVADPRDPDSLLAGIVFNDLAPNADVKVFAFGLNEAGARIARGESQTLVLSAGDERMIEIQLETCPGSPPNCD